MPSGVVVTSAGRRVQLINHLRAAMTAQSWSGPLLATDCSDTAPATHLADQWFLTPSASDEKFIPAMSEICQSEGLRLVIPTIDTELPVWALHREHFASRGTSVAVSSPECIEVTRNKLTFADWLNHNGIPAPHTLGVASDVTGSHSLPFPLHVKPVWGSRSVGASIVLTHGQLRERIDSSPDELLVQELLVGPEFTVSCFVGTDGYSKVEVPRERLEVRAGEVAKGRTVRNPDIEQLARTCVEALPGAFGPINVQIIATSNGPRVVEVNARFGGGDPLAWTAGADIPRMLLAEVDQPGATTRCDTWMPDVVMSRFDHAVYLFPDGHHEVG